MRKSAIYCAVRAYRADRPQAIMRRLNPSIPVDFPLTAFSLTLCQRLERRSSRADKMLWELLE
jgi:hypothetical protein